MKVFNFLKDVCLTDFSFVCLCIVALLGGVAFVSLLIGVITYHSYENNKISYHACHLFMIVMQIAWIVLLTALVIEFFAGFACAFIVKIGGVEFMVRFFATLCLIAGIVRLAMVVFDNDGRYVGHRTPYEKFVRFAKPNFWED